MTIVYLVYEHFDEYEASVVVKVFSTREKAQVFVEERKKASTNPEASWYIAEEELL